VWFYVNAVLQRIRDISRCRERDCLWVCTHIYIHIYIYIFTCINIYTYAYIYEYIYIYTHTYIYIHICGRAGMSKFAQREIDCVCVRVSLCARVHTCLHISHMYIHIHICGLLRISQLIYIEKECVCLNLCVCVHACSRKYILHVHVNTIYDLWYMRVYVILQGCCDKTGIRG